MIASDGIQWDKQSNALYTTDVFDNAVYKLDIQGKLTLLPKMAIPTVKMVSLMHQVK